MKVLIVHGWMHSAERYKKLKQDLEDAGAEVQLYELPGFGKTPAVRSNSLLEFYEKQLVGYLCSHEIDVIVGHSLGARIALRAVAMTNFKIKLVLLSPAYAGCNNSPLAIIGPLLLKAKAIAPDLLVRRLLCLELDKTEFVDSLGVKDVRRADAKTAAQLLTELRYDKWRTRCVRGTVLLLGDNDKLIEDRHTLQLVHDLGNCDVITLKNTGHAAIIESYNELLQTLLRILQKEVHNGVY